MSDYDDDSMTKDLRYSANGTFVTLDDSSHFTLSGQKPPGEQWSCRETIEPRGTKWKFDVEIYAGKPAPLEAR